MPAKTNDQSREYEAIARMKSGYLAAGWQVVNEEAGAIALSKPAHYVGSSPDTSKTSRRRPRTLLNWLFGRA